MFDNSFPPGTLRPRVFQTAAIVLNPAARQGRARYALFNLESPAVRHSCLFSTTRWHVLAPKTPAETISMVEQAAGQTELLIAAGGDGTAHCVANALMRLPEARRPVLAVLPLGTGNDFAKMLGFRPEINDPLAALSEGKLMRIDVGRCSENWFLNDFAIGIFSEATKIYHQLPRAVPGAMRYLVAAYGAIVRPWRKEMRLIADGQRLHEGPFSFLAIANGAWTGGKFRMNPQGSITDGWLDIWLCQRLSRPALLRNLPRLIKGDHAGHPAIAHWRAQRIEIQSDELAIYQMDGELAAFPAGGLEIEVVPGALQVLGF